MRVYELKALLNEMEDVEQHVVLFESRTDRDPSEESFSIDEIETGAGFVLLISKD